MTTTTDRKTETSGKAMHAKDTDAPRQPALSLPPR